MEEYQREEKQYYEKKNGRYQKCISQAIIGETLSPGLWLIRKDENCTTTENIDFYSEKYYKLFKINGGEGYLDVDKTVKILNTKALCTDYVNKKINENKSFTRDDIIEWTLVAIDEYNKQNICNGRCRF